MREPDFEFVEGAPGDLSFVARGARREDALAAAAEALLAATVEDPASVRSETRHVVALDAPDWDLLLLRLLNELVYLRDAEGLLLRVGRIETASDGSRVRLDAELVGEPWDPARHRPAAEVKAATVHGLALRATDHGWLACATLDV
jgi:SHS2 domain-containing protein